MEFLAANWGYLMVGAFVCFVSAAVLQLRNMGNIGNHAMKGFEEMEKHVGSSDMDENVLAGAVSGLGTTGKSFLKGLVPVVICALGGVTCSVLTLVGIVKSFVG